MFHDELGKRSAHSGKQNGHMLRDAQGNVLSAIDARSGWIVVVFGIVTAVVAAWLSLAWLGGTPSDAVEWVILGLIATFGYTAGTLVLPMVLYVLSLLQRLGSMLVMVCLLGGAGMVAMSLIAV